MAIGVERLLPDSEFEVMEVLWAMEAQGLRPSAAEMIAYSGTLGRLKLTTVLTLIGRLVNKGYISQEKQGRAYRYTSLVSETAYKQTAASRFVSTMYKNNAAGMISALYSDGALSEADILALKDLINSLDGGKQ